MTREKMTIDEAIAIIRKEYLCVDRDCDIERNCGKCDLMMPSKEPILEAYKIAIKALEQMPKILETLDFAIDASNGETNYFVGFRNGLRYSKLLIDGEEPQFEHCTEQEPKTGHWIETAEEYYKAVNEYGGGVNEDTPYFVDDIACSVCLAKYSVIDNETERFDCCPSCGVKLVEPQERSDKE